MEEKNSHYQSIENIADLLWLSQFTGLESVVETREKKEESNSSVEDNKEKTQPKESKKEEEQEEKSKEQEDAPEIHTQNQGDSKQKGSKEKSAKAFHSPKKMALSNYREWEKAFKFINLKSPSKNRFELDEERTVKNIASTKVFDLVFRNVEERYFFLTLIIDRSETMELWLELIKKFEEMLYTMGVFAKISVYYWNTEDELPKLYHDKALEKELHEKNVSIDGKRSLVLVMSDCLALSWRNGASFRNIEQWSKHSLVSIIQMFPKEMWAGTMLHKGKQRYLSSAFPNALNHKLVTNRRRRKKSLLQIPIISFNSHALQAWAKVVVATKGNAISGVEFDDLNFSDIPKKYPKEITAEMRLKRFYSQASPTAHKLASYMSVLPVEFQVTRILQEEKLPQSNQAHVAEVFLGGLIERKKEAERVNYEFYPEIRETLGANISAKESFEIMEGMSGFVSSHLGIGFDFSALISDPSGAFEGEFALSDESIAFARLASRVLKRQGGLGIETSKKIDGLVEKVNKHISKSEMALKNYLQAIENKKTNPQLKVLFPINYILDQRYEIKKVLGQGGNFITYLAKDLNLNKNVVIEEYNNYSFQNYSKPQERTLKLLSLSHPNIVPIIEIIEINDTFYSIREYIEGITLSNLDIPSEEKIINITISLLDALDYLKKHSLSHTDIHCGNVILDKNLKPYWIDYLDDRRTIFLADETIFDIILHILLNISDKKENNTDESDFFIQKYSDVFSKKIIDIIVLGLKGKINSFKDFIELLHFKNNTKSKKIFISVSSQSKKEIDLATQIYNELMEYNYDTFFAKESIKPRMNWNKAIDKALNECQYFIIFFSKKSTESEWIKEEIKIIKERQNKQSNGFPKILPIHIDSDNFILPFDLLNINGIPWKNESDTEYVCQEILDVIENKKIEEKYNLNHIFSKFTNKILWVDDNPSNNKKQVKQFQSIGIKFDFALSTNQALEYIEKNKYLVIISDMGRKEGSKEGYVLLDELRKSGNNTPYFIFSVQSKLLEEQEIAKEKGAQGSTDRNIFEMVVNYIKYILYNSIHEIALIWDEKKEKDLNNYDVNLKCIDIAINSGVMIKLAIAITIKISLSGLHKIMIAKNITKYSSFTFHSKLKKYLTNFDLFLKSYLQMALESYTFYALIRNRSEIENNAYFDLNYELEKDGIILNSFTFNIHNVPEPLIVKEITLREPIIIKIPNKNYAIGKYLVTIYEYMDFVNDVNAHHPEWTDNMEKYKSINLSPHTPIIAISWHDAEAYCKWLGEKNNKKYRLPSEEEWETACQAGSTTQWCYGDNQKELNKYAWYAENTSSTQVVGQKNANSWGIYDMHGNVWEWCLDQYWLDEGYISKIIKGGSFLSDATNTTSTTRNNASPKSRAEFIGFRVLLEL